MARPDLPADRILVGDVVTLDGKGTRVEAIAKSSVVPRFRGDDTCYLIWSSRSLSVPVHSARMRAMVAGSK